MRDASKYVVDGLPVPSVTSCLGFAGMTDMSGIPLDVLENARQRGVDVDDWIELVLLGHISRDEQPEERIRNYVAAYFKAEDELGIEVIDTQGVVIHPTQFYAGMYDIFGYMRKSAEPDRPYIIDIKCVAMISHAVQLQLAGYGIAKDYERSTLPSGQGYHGRASLQLKGDGTYRLKRAGNTDTPNSWDASLDDHDWYAVVRTAHFKLRHNMVELEKTR